jgi:hypothetical protein
MSDFGFQSAGISIQGTTNIPGFTASVTGIVNSLPSTPFGYTALIGFTAGVSYLITQNPPGYTAVLGFTSGVLSLAQTQGVTSSFTINSGTCSSLTTTSVSYVDITNLSLNIGTSGRPIWLGLVPSNGASYEVRYSGAGSPSGLRFRLLRYGGSTSIITESQESFETALAGTVPISSFNWLDNPVGGTWTYTLQGKAIGSSTAVSFENLIFRAIQL